MGTRSSIRADLSAPSLADFLSRLFEIPLQYNQGSIDQQKQQQSNIQAPLQSYNVRGFAFRVADALGDKRHGGTDWMRSGSAISSTIKNDSLSFERALFIELADQVSVNAAVARLRETYKNLRPFQTDRSLGENHVFGGDKTRCMETQRIRFTSEDACEIETVVVPDSSGGESVSNLFRLESTWKIRALANAANTSWVTVQVSIDFVATCTKKHTWGLGGMIERTVLKRAERAHEVWLKGAKLELALPGIISAPSSANAAGPAQASHLERLDSDGGSSVGSEQDADSQNDEELDRIRLAHLRRVLVGTEKLRGVLRAAARAVHQPDVVHRKESDTEDTMADLEAGAAVEAAPVSPRWTQTSRQSTLGATPSYAIVTCIFLLAVLAIWLLQQPEALHTQN